MIPKPPLEILPSGTVLRAGCGTSTIIADFDFETFSPAGFIWNPLTNKWGTLPNAKAKGLPVVGAAKYTEHPDAEVLCLAYNLKNGNGPQQWVPGQSPPFDLLDYVKNGGLLEAWNCGFEYWVWTNICVPKYGWPQVSQWQLRDAMAKARAHALPGSLDECAKVLGTSRKDKHGKRLLEKFTKPRNPTKNDPRLRINPREDAIDGQLFYNYNLQDIVAEAEASSQIPDLPVDELEFWQYDRQINTRGVQVDLESIDSCIKIIEQAHSKYNAELRLLTGGQVQAASEIAKLTKWVSSQGVMVNSLDAEVLESLLTKIPLPPQVKRVLEIRSLIGSAAVKKVYAMKNQVTRDGRLHDLFIYHSARTGRAAGAGPQPQNLPNSGPDVYVCNSCERQFCAKEEDCPWCGTQYLWTSSSEWNATAVENALGTIKTGSLECVEYYWGDAVATVSGCLRGLFTSAPNHDLICSDYSAIEAVVLAALAGEEWRMEVFRTHGKIYEMSAAKITGIPFEEFMRHKAESGQHHPMRKKVGKVAELASGYQGWITAWKQFGADEFFNDEEIKKSILAWRAASPAIVEMWGGQERNWQTEYYGLEGAAVQAVLSPSNTFSYRGITYVVHDDVLYCQLLSGRFITYHKPRLKPSDFGRRGLSLSFEGWNTNPKYGVTGWQRMSTYGGRLTENIVQATARDILTHAIVALEKSGYPVVLHIHDEIVSEVPESVGSIEHFEKIMSTMPTWAAAWPIRATGGWRGKRYRKE